MTSLRYENRSTDTNASNIIKLLNDAKTNRVILFSSETQPKAPFGQSDGPESNLPLVAALVEFKIPGVTPIHIVFDGLFLTAVRSPRYSEVITLLEAAISSGKAFYSLQRAPFTSSLSPAEAANKLLKLGPVVPLTSASRSAYFGLLSLVPEELLT